MELEIDAMEIFCEQVAFMGGGWRGKSIKKRPEWLETFEDEKIFY